VVPTGNIGYVEVFQKVKDKTYQPGLNWFIPIITDRYLMDTRVQEFSRVDKKMIVLGTDIVFRETFNYRLNKDLVHVVFSTMGPNYWSTVMEWVDNSIDNVTSKFSYAEIRANQEGFKDMLLKGVQTTVEKKCRELTSSLYPTPSLVDVYELENIFDTIEDPTNPGTFISVPKMIEVEEDGVVEKIQVKEMVAKSVTLQGINFFDLMTLTINDIKYPEAYQEARDKLVKERVAVAVAKETAKRVETLAEAKKKAKELEAEAEATAIRKKGEAENEVLAQRALTLEQNPALIQETVAKHYPTVVGNGVMPTLSVGHILRKKKDEEEI
jgi:regulator of protease activity HflC (stomatin/prohibitin superfamily)